VYFNCRRLEQQGGSAGPCGRVAVIAYLSAGSGGTAGARTHDQRITGALFAVMPIGTCLSCTATDRLTVRSGADAAFPTYSQVFIAFCTGALLGDVDRMRPHQCTDPDSRDCNACCGHYELVAWIDEMGRVHYTELGVERR
jgi:hypothetical protein